MTSTRHRGLVRIASPASEPLLLAEVKDYLRITHTEDDTYLSELIITARTACEQFLHQSLVTQSWKLSFNDYPYGVTFLPMRPVQSIISVVITGSDGGTTTFAAANYRLNAAGDAIVFTSLPTGVKIDISYVAGYGSSTAIPKPIKHGLLAHVAALYDGECSSSDVPERALQLYHPYREVRI